MFSFSFSRLVEAYRLAKRMFGDYKKQIIILATLGLFSGLLEAIGVNALIPLFSFFVKSDERLGGDTIANYIRDFFAFFHMPFTLPILLIFICVLFTFKGVIALYFNYLRTKICLEYDRTIRSALYKDTLYANWPYLSQQKVGHLETVIMTNVRMCSRLLESISRHVVVVS